MNALLNFDRALDSALCRLGQTRRERLEPREVVGARGRGPSQRRVALGGRR